ncbi:MAG: hypothetical protein Hyperionvirus23_21 [Hyperionvirus sp.]|uniref:Uncharacterized protein n=1 Tax=Hyperionvirus sp. TaxID=2487770 RepID=A0A3G5ACM4_9VIRU|nr:MAG: hypothetical protein Hyperionvirus23_21 [Hyperionvirus sp.]
MCLGCFKEKIRCSWELNLWTFLGSGQLVISMGLIICGIVFLSLGVPQFMGSNVGLVPTVEYFVAWQYGKYEEIGAITAPEFVVDSIPGVNNTLMMCDNITAELLDGNYTDRQCLKSVCVEQGGCHPCNYICESSVCLVKEQQETCVSEMALIGCTVTYTAKTVYVCPNYPTKVIADCLQECSDMLCAGYGSCDCTNCTQMGLRVFNFAINTLATIVGQFRYLVNGEVFNSSQLYSFACSNANDPFCGVNQLILVPQMNLRGHSVEKNCWWQGCISTIDPLTIYYNINDPTQTVGGLTSNSDSVAMICVGCIEILGGLILLTFLCCACCKKLPNE